MMTDVEGDIIAPLEKCMTQFVQNVSSRPKFLSSLQKTGLYTAENAIRRKDQTDIDPFDPISN